MNPLQTIKDFRIIFCVFFIFALALGGCSTTGQTASSTKESHESFGNDPGTSSSSDASRQNRNEGSNAPRTEPKLAPEFPEDSPSFAYEVEDETKDVSLPPPESAESDAPEEWEPPQNIESDVLPRLWELDTETENEGAPVLLETEDYYVKEIFYGTNRVYTGASSSPKFYNAERNNKLELGVAQVTIPRERVEGSLPRPTIFKLEFSEDPSKHVILKRVTQLTTSRFMDRLKSQLGPNNEAVVFVHGYNTTFEEAAQRTAQMAFDLEFQGAPILYSWPSWGNEEDYVTDLTNSRVSARYLKDFLTLLTQNVKTGKLHLIAHSMGNQVLTNALSQLNNELQTHSSGPTFSEIIFAAPDVDIDEFKDLAQRFHGISKGQTLYTSRNDKVLKLSKKIRQDLARAGDSENGILILPDIASVDVSKVDSTFLGHSYWGGNTSVITDIYWLLKGVPPSRRTHLQEDFLGNLKYWIFK